MREDELVATIVERRTQQSPCVDIVYPQVEGLPNKKVQREINQLIEKQANKLFAGEGCNGVTITGNYAVKLNQKSLLSIRLEAYLFRQGAAHGMTLANSLTVDLKTGKVYGLRDLFKSNSHYIYKISEMIKAQIKERDLPLLREFNRITDRQDFYLTKDDLVIYFQIYDYTPYVVGIPEFVIPLRRLERLAKEDSPIPRLLGR